MIVLKAVTNQNGALNDKGVTFEPEMVSIRAIFYMKSLIFFIVKFGSYFWMYLVYWNIFGISYLCILWIVYWAQRRKSMQTWKFRLRYKAHVREESKYRSETLR